MHCKAGTVKIENRIVLGDIMAKKKNFEDSFAKLEEAAAALKNEAVSLEDSIKHYENASKYYEECKTILEDAKQRIYSLDKDSDELSEMEQ